jgi:hypothetical protein
MKTYTVRVFQDADGYHWCPDTLPYLDARNRAYGFRSQALRVAFRAGYTHARIGSSRRQISALVTLDQYDHADHARAASREEAAR